MISIIIPCYNHAAALPELLASIKAQTYTDWEVIVVNDGSRDNCEQVVHTFQERAEWSQRLTYIHQDNAGAPTARNNGAHGAKGEYLLFADADLVLTPNALAELYEALQHTPSASYAYCDFQFGWKAFPSRSFDAAKLREDNYIHTSALIRRPHFPDFDQTLKRFQDWDLWLTMLAQNHTGVHVAKKLFDVRITRQGISSWKPRAWYAACRRWPSLAPKSYWQYEAARRVVLKKHTATQGTAQPRTSIIIVSWNVRDDLEKCLRSIVATPCFQKGETECLVIDNNSNDDTALMVKEKFNSITYIQNRANAGFGRACNIGAAEAVGEYLIFLNPDTTLDEKTLKKIEGFFADQPFVGIIGPQLRHPDERIQWSCRTFPSLFVACLLLTKLDRIFPTNRSLQNYLMTSFRHETLRAVDQVMGACLAIRRTAFISNGGFDERFYIWFEDVDMCRQVKKGGWLTFFLPEAKVYHGLSTGFQKRNIVWKQWQLTCSGVKYFLKNNSLAHGLLAGLAGTVGLMVSVAVLPFSPILDSFKATKVVTRAGEELSENRPARRWVFFLGFFAASYIGHLDPTLEPVLFFLAIIGEVFLALVAYPYAVLVALAEVVVGSDGHALIFTWSGFTLSLRMAFFVVVVTAGLLKGSRIFWPLPADFMRRILPLLLFGVSLMLAVIVGLLQGYQKTLIYNDANAYIYFLMIIPIVVARALDPKFLYRCQQLLLAGAMVLSALTLGLHYIFTHDFLYTQAQSYLWLRHTLLAELTFTTTGAWRIFFPSQLYVLVAWCMLACAPLQLPRRAFMARIFTLAVLASALLLSFSRSFWFGWLGAVALIGFWFLRQRRHEVWKFILLLTSQAVIAFAILVVILYFPLPKRTAGGNLSFINRLDVFTEAAASSRWNELKPLWKTIKQHPVFGSGFGTSVTYISNDPRVRSAHPDGRYTTTAFEWGYLDMIVKFGFVGLGLFLWICALISWSIMKSSLLSYDKMAFLSAFLALLLSHAVSPYLNHPLGITFFLLLLAISLSGNALTFPSKSASI